MSYESKHDTFGVEAYDSGRFDRKPRGFLPPGFLFLGYLLYIVSLFLPGIHGEPGFFFHIGLVLLVVSPLSIFSLMGLPIIAFGLSNLVLLFYIFTGGQNERSQHLLRGSVLVCLLITPLVFVTEFPQIGYYLWFLGTLLILSSRRPTFDPSKL